MPYQYHDTQKKQDIQVHIKGVEAAGSYVNIVIMGLPDECDSRTLDLVANKIKYQLREGLMRAWRDESPPKKRDSLKKIRQEIADLEPNARTSTPIDGSQKSVPVSPDN